MKRVRYPKEAYQDLVDLLDLPSQGYTFSHLAFPEVSKLTTSLYDSPAKSALELLLKMRQSDEAEEVRARWAERVWNSGSSCSIGAEYAGNVLSNSTVYGSVFQNITLASTTT
jgi:hypothetical protein